MEANSMGYHNEDNILLTRTKFLPYIRQYRPFSFHCTRIPLKKILWIYFPKILFRLCAKVQSQVVLM